MASKFAASPFQQFIKSERSMLPITDEGAIMKQIMATHSSDGKAVDVKSLFQHVKDALNRAKLGDVGAIYTTTQTVEEILDDETLPASSITIFSFTIDQLESEMLHKCFTGGEPHGKTISILNMLAAFPWEAKLVLTLAAFALIYGQICLLAQSYSSNPLAKSMAIMKQVLVVLERSATLKPLFDAMNNLSKAMVELTGCIMEFKGLPPLYISEDAPPLSTAIAHFPIAVYWTIRGVIACVSQTSILAAVDQELVLGSGANVTWELSSLTYKINNIKEHLKKQLEICYQHIEDMQNQEIYKLLINLLDGMQIDNMKLLKTLIYPNEDLQPLLDGSTKKRVSLDVLRRKNVLLLISSLDFPRDELMILEQIYNESRVQTSRMDYEIVWIPIVDRYTEWADPLQKQFETLQATMPWYTVYSPSLIKKPVIKFIREVWHFRNKPILVVLDPLGKVVSPNAIHMMWIWGSVAFPFTSLREEALWKEESWKLELLVDNVDPTILSWIKDGRYIYLYGGTDMDWIRKFTTSAKAVASAARIPLEMVYVGKSNKRELVRKCTTAITEEKLSYCWQDLAMVWFFWTRLQSMMFSKIQLGSTVDVDPLLREIKKLLCYDKEGGWAVLSNGSFIFVNGHSSSVLPTFVDYDAWKGFVPSKGFDVACMNYHNNLRPDSRPCCRLEFPSTIGRIPELMKCPDCLSNMEKYMTFLCCHDESTINALI